MGELQLGLILPVVILVAWALLILLFRSPGERDRSSPLATFIDVVTSPWAMSLSGVAFATVACLKQWSLTTLEA